MYYKMKRACTPVLLVAVAASLLVLVPATPAAAVSPDLVISQIYGGGGNSGATLRNDFIEVYNRGTETVSVEGWSVQYASAAGSTWQVTVLDGQIPPGRHYLVQEAQGAGGSVDLPTPDATGTIAMAAGSGKVALVTNSTPLTAVCGANCDTAPGVRDYVGYGSTATDFEGTGPTPTLSNTTAALRVAGGATDTDNNATDFTVGAPNPRNCGADCAPDVPPPPPPSGCDAAATHEIGFVQGQGSATPVAGQGVRVEGIVTGDFNDSASELGGIYIQDDTPDTDPLTSDGLFVATSVAVATGDRVRVSGTAAESFGETRINATAVDVCGTGAIAPTPYDLPRPAGATFEPVEGVLLTFPEALTATEHFQLGRFGEVTVSSDGRLFQPTDRVDPGTAAQALLAESQRRRLLIDDASNVQNPATVPFTSPDALRIGDSATGITGVLGFGFSQFRLQPTQPITFARTNSRPAAPAAVGGDIKVASFNTLNYFTTLGSENPDARGADTAEEFNRQQAKEVAAITGINADIVGLMEIENNGSVAVANLVDALNAATAPGTYAYITEPSINPPNEFGGTFGTDAIKVALIYRPAAVVPVGPAQTTINPLFDRPPLIQTFERVGGSEDVAVVVNHFKSKNCGGASGPDADQGDGQACFNERRTLQAQTLVDRLASLAVPNPLIIGDLNAYTEEDPIHLLEDAGYTGLSELFVPPADRYSYVFDGFSGELDHALAAPSLLDNVTGTTIWHINADEPLILDYNTEFNPAGLYAPNAYRSSDHDPLIVGLNLAANTVPAAPTVNAVAGFDAVTVDWTAPANGGTPITEYRVSASRGGAVVASVTVGPGVTSYTFGALVNGVTYDFSVVATNAVGEGAAGVTSATPFLPATYVRLDATLSCPSFSVTNANAFPISFRWTASSGQSGTGVVGANATVSVTVTMKKPRGTTAFSVLIGDKSQDTVTGRC